MNKLSIALLSMTGMFSVATPVSAQLISQTFTVTSQDSNNPVAYFDSNLGTLQSVRLSASYSANGSYTVTHPYTGICNGNSTGNAVVSYGFTVTNTDTYDFAFSNLYYSFPSYSSTTPYDLPSGQSQTTIYASGLVNGSNISSSQSILATFTKSGLSTFNAVASLNQIGYYAVSIGPANFSQTGGAIGTYTLDYNYLPSAVSPISAVPEPATWAMMILGMGTVGYAMRRRQKIVTRASYAA